MSVEVLGVDATIATIGTHVADFNIELDAIIQAAGMECEGMAVAICPVDTGELQGSITYVPGFLECEVYTDSDHAVYVEFGTSKMSDQPFMLPSYDIASVNMQDKIKQL